MTATADATIVPTAHLSGFMPSPLNPRKNFSAESLTDIVASLAALGEVVQPVLVRSHKIGKFELIDGERRWRGAEKAGIKSIPYLRRDDLTDAQCIEIMLVSSIHKRELSPLEEAAGYKSWMTAYPAANALAFISERVGRTQKHIADRMRLLDLIPEVKVLLERALILAAHGERLATLKPDQQKAIAAPEGPLWIPEAGGLFETDDDPYSGKKAITVRELDAYIKKHIHFDVEHAAKTAPIDFGPVAQKVEQANDKPGRGRKSIEITHETFVQPSAKGEERIYGPRTWRQADGSKGHPKCDHAVLGVFVVGHDYGTSLDVCIAREKCPIHWKKEIDEKVKNDKLRAKGKGGQAAQREADAAEKRRLQAEESVRKQKIWQAIQPHVMAEAISQVKGIKTLTPAHAKALSNVHHIGLTDAKSIVGPNWFKNPAGALLALAVGRFYAQDYDAFIRDKAKPFGLDVKKLQAVRDKHAPKAAVEADTETTKKASK